MSNKVRIAVVGGDESHVIRALWPKWAEIRHFGSSKGGIDRLRSTLAAGRLDFAVLLTRWSDNSLFKHLRGTATTVKYWDHGIPELAKSLDKVLDGKSTDLATVKSLPTPKNIAPTPVENTSTEITTEQVSVEAAIVKKDLAKESVSRVSTKKGGWSALEVEALEVCLMNFAGDAPQLIKDFRELVPESKRSIYSIESALRHYGAKNNWSIPVGLSSALLRLGQHRNAAKTSLVVKGSPITCQKCKMEFFPIKYKSDVKYCSAKCRMSAANDRRYGKSASQFIDTAHKPEDESIHKLLTAVLKICAATVEQVVEISAKIDKLLEAKNASQA